MHRRNFLKYSSTLAATCIALKPSTLRGLPLSGIKKEVNTVNGKISPEALGIVLPHEHLFSNFGSDPESTDKYDEDKLIGQVIPYLQHLKSLDCNTVIDCTTAYFGRRVDILKKISQITDVRIITNTGYYGAANDKYVPQHVYSDSAEKIAEIWTAEYINGIDGTGIKPGFIKTGIDNGPLSETDAKLVKSAALAHLNTGLTIAVHTGNNVEAAEKQIDILTESGVHPNAWIWTHANKVDNAQPLIRAAEKGAWISLDGIRDNSSQIHHLNLLNDLKKAGLLSSVLLSHDGNGFPGGKEIRPFHALFTEFIPLLKANNYSDEDITRLISQNPQKAFTIQIRKI